MQRLSPHLETLIQRGLLLAANVLARDHLHLAPARVSLVIAARFRAGLRALHAYLRRVILLLAVQMEPGLKPDMRPLLPRTGPQIRGRKAPSIPVFSPERARPDDFFDAQKSRQNHAATGPQSGLDPAPLLARFAALKALLSDPAARARRLALHLKRRHDGPVLVPDIGRNAVPRRLGSEISSLYAALHHQILTESRGRSPPIGPRPRPPPRIRLL